MSTTTEAAVVETAAFRVQDAFDHRPALDGVRTVAVLLVIAFHAGMNSLRNGFVGVDLFFVLSGFLVTSILLTELQRTGTISLRKFYARRMRRLLPASAVVLVLTAVIWAGLVPVTERSSVATDARWAALYSANWRFVDSATDYFAEAASPSPFLHFWSLAIEEQFYVVFPLLVLALWRVSRRGPGSALPLGLGALMLVSVGLQLYWDRTNTVRAYYGTDARLYQLLAGALLAVVFVRRRPTLTAGRAGLLAAAGLVVIGVISTPLLSMSLSTTGIVATIASLALLAGLELGPRTLVARSLSGQTMVHLGQISYGTYLWHWPITLVLQRLFVLEPWVLAIVVLVLSTGMAEASAQLVEGRIRRNKVLDSYPRAVTTAGLASTVPIAVVASWALSTDAPSKTRQIEAARPLMPTEEVVDLGPSPRDVDWDAVAGTPDSGVLPRNHRCWAGNIDDCVVVEGSGERLLLIGDSHSRMMLPVLTEYARSRDVTLLASTDNGCGWIEGLREWEAEGSNVDRCNGERDDWTTELTAALDVDTVILVQRAREPDKFAIGQSEFLDPAEQALGYPDGVNAAVTRTIDDLLSVGVKVVVLEPTPLAPFDPIACLADRPDVADCVWPVTDDPLGIESTTRSIDAARAEVSSISLDDIACPDLPLCIPYIDGEFVYRDTNHVQPSWWLSNGDELGRRLDAALL